MPRKGDLLWKCLPNRKTDTQMGKHEPNIKTCPRKKTPEENAFPTGRLTPKIKITNQRGILAPERRLIKKTSSQQEDCHPKRKSRTQQKDLPQKEDSLRKRLPSRKTDTQTANRTPSRNSGPRKETYYENAFPTGRLTPKWQITNPTGRLAGERRPVEKMPSQQEGWHPSSKAQTKQEDLHQKKDSLRKRLTNRKTDQNDFPTGRLTPEQQSTNQTRRLAPYKKTH